MASVAFCSRKAKRGYAWHYFDRVAPEDWAFNNLLNTFKLTYSISSISSVPMRFNQLDFYMKNICWIFFSYQKPNFKVWFNFESYPHDKLVLCPKN